MKTMFWIITAVAFIILALWFYPSIITMINFGNTLISSIPGYTPDTASILLLESLPLVALGIIIYVGWRIATRNKG